MKTNDNNKLQIKSRTKKSFTVCHLLESKVIELQALRRQVIKWTGETENKTHSQISNWITIEQLLYLRTSKHRIPKWTSTEFQCVKRELKKKLLNFIEI